MRFNFRKISALASSALMIGMTAGIAAAANYPAPFVVGGTADVAVVYGTGTGVSALDVVQAGNIQSSLQSFMGGTTGGTTASTSGEVVSLDTSADRIWLNTSLNAVKSTITKSDLPTILGDYTFSGNVDSKVTSTIKLIAGTAAGGENSGKVIFVKQPSGSDDPVIGISMGTSAAAQPLYNASATMAAINFKNEDSEGEEIVLFGQTFTVASATDTDTLVLLKQAEKVSLSSDTPASTVTVGESKDTIDGTLVYLNGGNTGGGDPANSTTEIAIAVFRPDSTHDAILPGTSFVDPVFGSFKIDFAGLTSPLDDASRDMISVTTAGDDTVSVKFTEQGGNEKSVDFAHNESLMWRLADDSNFSIAVKEMENLSYASGTTKYVVVGNEDYGHLLELYDVYNQTTGSSAITNDRVKFKDVFTGSTYETTFSATEGSGTIDVDGKRYTVYFNGTGEAAYVQIKYPTSDSSTVNSYVVFPTIETKQGALIQLYQPTLLNLTDMNSSTGRNDAVAGTQAIGGGAQILLLPDGDGYTSVTLTNNATAGYDSSWEVGSNTTADLTTNTTATTYNAIGLNTNITFTVGTISYRL